MSNGAIVTDTGYEAEERAWARVAMHSLAKYWNTPKEDAAWAYLQEESPAQFDTEARLKQSQTAVVSVA